MVPSDLLEFDLSEQRIKEHFEENKHVFILLPNFLNPLDVDFVSDVFKRVLELRYLPVKP